MIKLTTMNQQVFYLNNDLIYRIESAPDTIITLIDGKTLMVLETAETVVEAVVSYQQRIYRQAPTDLLAQSKEFDA